jgi:hypothetical protein
VSCPGFSFEFWHYVLETKKKEVLETQSYKINHTLHNINAGTDTHQSQPLFFGEPGTSFTPGTSHHPIPHIYDCALAYITLNNKNLTM